MHIISRMILQMTGQELLSEEHYRTTVALLVLQLLFDVHELEIDFHKSIFD